MNYIVFDLEWNQCPDGKERENKQLPFEIIEIGAVKLNEEKEILDTFHCFIRPVVYRRLHYRTREVIELNAADLQNGLPFAKAVRKFLEFCGDDHRFFTWGTMDLMELQRNLRYYGKEDWIRPPVFFGDVQKLFAISFEDKTKRRSLEYAVRYLDIELEGEFHAALDDAMYTAYVLRRIPTDAIRGNYSIDTYQVPRSEEEEIRIRYRSYEKHISRAFPERETLLKDPDVSALNCLVCHRTMDSVLPWYSSNQRNYEAVGICSVHGWTKSKIRIRKTEDSEFYSIKTSRRITGEELDGLREKRRKREKKKGKAT